MLTLFKNLGYKIEDYPMAYQNYACEISLPIYPQLTNTEVEFIITSVISCVHIQLNSHLEIEEGGFSGHKQMAVAS